MSNLLDIYLNKKKVINILKISNQFTLYNIQSH